MRDFKAFQVGVLVLEVRLVGQGSVVWLDWGWVVVLVVFVYDADAIGCGRHDVVCRIRRTLHSLVDFLGALAASREKLHALDYAAKTVCRSCYGQFKDKRCHNKHDKCFSDSCSHKKMFYFLPNPPSPMARSIFRLRSTIRLCFPPCMVVFGCRCCMVIFSQKVLFLNRMDDLIHVLSEDFAIRSNYEIHSFAQRLCLPYYNLK